LHGLIVTNAGEQTLMGVFVLLYIINQ